MRFSQPCSIVLPRIADRTTKSFRVPIRNGLVVLLSLAGGAFSPLAPCGKAAAADVDFTRDIQPLLVRNCVPCHNQTTTEADLNLETHTSMMNGGASGEPVIPGVPEDSFLYLVAAGDSEPVMPPMPNKANARRLNPSELAMLKQWIAEGARPSAESADSVIKWEDVPTNLKAVFDAEFDPRGRYIAAARGNLVTVHSLTGPDSDAFLNAAAADELPRSQRDIVQSISVHPTGNLIATGGYRSIRVWQRQYAARSFRLPESQNPVIAALLTSASELLFVSRTPTGLQAYLGAFTDKPEDTPAKESPGEWSSFETAVRVSAANLMVVDELSFPDPVAASTTTRPSDQIMTYPVSGAPAIAVTGQSQSLNLMVVREKRLQHVQIPLPSDETAPLRASSMACYNETLLLILANRLYMIPLFGAAMPAEPRPVVWPTGQRPAPSVVAVASSVDGSKTWIVDSDGTVRGIESLNQDGTIQLRNTSSGPESPGTPEVPTDWLPVGNYLLARSPNAPPFIVDTEKAAATTIPLPVKQPAVTAAHAHTEGIRKAWEARRGVAAALLKESEASLNEAQAERTKAQTTLEAAQKEREKNSAAVDDSAKKRNSAQQAAVAAPDDQALAAELKKAEEAHSKLLTTLQDSERNLQVARQSVEFAEQYVQRMQSAMAGRKSDLQRAESAIQATPLPSTDRGDAGAEFYATTNRIAVVDQKSGRVAAGHLAPEGMELDDTLALPDAKSVARSSLCDHLLLLEEGGSGHVLSPIPEWTLVSELGKPGDPESPLTGRVTALAWSPDGRRLAAGSGEPSRSGQVLLWSPANAENPVTSADELHSDTVLSLAWSPTGEWIVTGSSDKFAKLLNPATLQSVQAFEGHTNYVHSATFSPDAGLLATASADESLKIWNVDTGRQTRTIKVHSAPITDAAFRSATEVLSTAGDQRALRLNQTNGQVTAELPRSPDYVHCLAISADGRQVVFGIEAGLVRVVDIDSGAILKEFSSTTAR